MYMAAVQSKAYSADGLCKSPAWALAGAKQSTNKTDKFSSAQQQLGRNFTPV